jgi:hypothetical protein
MPTEVVMPKMGESIAEGTLTKWLVEVGAWVEKDQGLFKISTDKVDAEIPSPASGVLREILCPAGTTVPVNSIVAWITADMAEPVPAVETLPSVRRQPSAPSLGTSMSGAGTLIDSLHLTRSEERELRQIIGLGPPEPRSFFERLLYGPYTGGVAILMISLIVLFSVAWLFDGLRPWLDILITLFMPFFMILFLVWHSRCRGLVFKVYRALEEERLSRRTGEG